MIDRYWRVAAAMLLASVLAVPPVFAADGPPVAGVVTDTDGRPRVKSKGDRKPRRLRVNKFVKEGDVITTGPGERVAIALLAGAEIRINESSEFIVETGGSGNKTPSLFSRAGQAWTRMIHGRSGLNIRTPIAVAAVRGTEADVDIHDRMTVKVYEGHVDLMNQLGKTSLYAGQMAQALSGKAPGSAQAVGDDAGSWQNGLDPKDLEGKLKSLHDAAGETRRTTGCFTRKDGTRKCFDFGMKKK